MTKGSHQANMAKKKRSKKTDLPSSKQNDDQHPKKIRSVAPDVTVVVGKGDNRKKFQCYKAFLAFASPVLDVMLSTDMVERNINRIDFPEKDPNEWEVFYKFVMHDDKVSITKDNAMALTTYFHEFQMNKYLQQCDDMLSAKIKSTTLYGETGRSGYTKRSWSYNQLDESEVEERKEALNEAIEMIEFSCLYDLTSTKEAVGNFIQFLVDNSKETHYLFELPVIETLLELSLPLIEKENYGKKNYISDGRSDAFFNALIGTPSCRRGFLYKLLEELPLDDINQNKMLPLLIHAYLKPQP